MILIVYILKIKIWIYCNMSIWYIKIIIMIVTKLNNAINNTIYNEKIKLLNGLSSHLRELDEVDTDKVLRYLEDKISSEEKKIIKIKYKGKTPETKKKKTSKKNNENVKADFSRSLSKISSNTSKKESCRHWNSSTLRDVWSSSWTFFHDSQLGGSCDHFSSTAILWSAANSARLSRQRKRAILCASC